MCPSPSVRQSCFCIGRHQKWTKEAQMRLLLLLESLTEDKRDAGRQFCFRYSAWTLPVCSLVYRHRNNRHSGCSLDQLVGICDSDFDSGDPLTLLPWSSVLRTIPWFHRFTCPKQKLGAECPNSVNQVTMKVSKKSPEVGCEVWHPEEDGCGQDAM